MLAFLFHVARNAACIKPVRVIEPVEEGNVLFRFTDELAHGVLLRADFALVEPRRRHDFRRERAEEFLERGLTVEHAHDVIFLKASALGGGRDSFIDAAELIEMAAMIESPCLIVHSGARGGHTHNHASRLFRMALEQLLPRAEEHNVALAIEPMHPGCAWEWTLLKTLEDTAEILQQFPSPHLQLVYDMYHFPAPPQPLLEVLLPRMAIVQLGDACQPPHGEQNRCPLGEGEVPLGSLVCELEALGYTGFYEVELRGEDVEALTYRELVEQSVEMFEHLMSSREPGAR